MFVFLISILLLTVDHPCHHTFCRGGLFKWLQNYNSTCPTCRERMSRNSPISITLLSFLGMLEQIPVSCKLCGPTNIQRGNFQDHFDRICPKPNASKE
jgi:hypothetical protein